MYLLVKWLQSAVEPIYSLAVTFWNGTVLGVWGFLGGFFFLFKIFFFVWVFILLFDLCGCPRACLPDSLPSNFRLRAACHAACCFGPVKRCCTGRDLQGEGCWKGAARLLSVVLSVWDQALGQSSRNWALGPNVGCPNSILSNSQTCHQLRQHKDTL